jgi:predicted metal-dependent phosphoesterase TrpH
MVESNFVLSLNEAFWRYLGDNKAAFVPKYRISTIDAIIMIKKAGGLSFLAHPGSDLPEKLIIDFIKQGLCGIEVIHPRHSKKEISFFRELIKEYNILECGGSDYHSDCGNQANIGEYILSYDIVEKMKARL